MIISDLRSCLPCRVASHWWLSCPEIDEYVMIFISLIGFQCISFWGTVTELDLGINSLYYDRLMCLQNHHSTELLPYFTLLAAQGAKITWTLISCDCCYAGCVLIPSCSHLFPNTVGLVVSTVQMGILAIWWWNWKFFSSGMHMFHFSASAGTFGFSWDKVHGPTPETERELCRRQFGFGGRDAA